MRLCSVFLVRIGLFAGGFYGGFEGFLVEDFHEVADLGWRHVEGQGWGKGTSVVAAAWLELEDEIWPLVYELAGYKI